MMFPNLPISFQKQAAHKINQYYTNTNVHYCGKS